MSSAIKTPAFQAKAGNIQNEDGSSIYSGGEWSFKNASAVTGFHITASGNVGIGTTSPASRLHVNAGGNYGILTMQAVNGSDIVFTSGATAVSSIAVDSTAGANSVMIFRNGGNTERMRIDTVGNLNVGGTSLSYTSNSEGGLVCARGFGCRAGVYGGPTNVFNINWTGSPQLWIDNVNVGTFTLTSDYRIKKNIETQELPAIERIAQLRPVKYEFADYKELFKADGVQREGFIAHELQAVIPSAVDGEKDDENQIQSLKLDALCAVMVKAIQELSAKVDAQAEEIKALKAQP